MANISSSKWDKYLAFQTDVHFHSYLPETKLCTQVNFNKMMKEYNSVVIKPSKGRLGKGVMKVTLVGEDDFHIEYLNHTVKKTGVEAAYRYIAEHQEKPCIVQEWIPLAKIDNAMFDLRVMVQRKKKSNKWKVTGVAARVTYPQSIITNAAVKIIPLQEALNQAEFSAEVNRSAIINEVYTLGLKAAAHLQDFYPKKRAFGLDVAIDHSGSVWIIEANLKPMINIFERMGDKQVNAVIKEYKNSGRKRRFKGDDFK
ncbi:YheC/D-like protein [Salsuginibacillus halophilus]|uniref:YheC/D-like protein n=1 Tax=Salsuginibacillus halophilus TaxID=517424 RepID=A0A2P8HLA8_9BACI|nr:YheC/YheD family protein [Salsuginibacillus halophilus]PSL46960.1 YheC/D-like protein [Salsuginibacillus halophilus]